MKAEDIRDGFSNQYWTATGDAKVEGNEVSVPATFNTTGNPHTRVFAVGHEVEGHSPEEHGQ